MKAFKRLPLSLAVAIGSLSSSTWAAVEDPGLCPMGGSESHHYSKSRNRVR